MPKKLLLINVVLIAIAAGSAVFIVRQVMAPTPIPLPTRGRPAPAASAVARPAEPVRTPPGAYTTVAAKNLFSPTRTEAPVSPTASAPAVAQKPNLYGVVLREGSPIAYLEDPATKRVAGYRVGDSIVGGTVQTINADSVVINRPDGKLDVRLRDPSKPRPTPAPATAAVPGVPRAQPAGQPAMPGVIPPTPVPGAPATVPPTAVVPGQPQPSQVTPPTVIPGRRPLPPNLLRRLPPAASDAPQQ
jgi:hypothetical protein